MKYLTLNNGVQMPIVGFGTWGVCGKTGKHSILEALEAGYRLIDTAQMYHNEEKADIEKSLNNLQTNYIDLLLIHEPYQNALEMYEAFKEAYQDGKLRAIGISNFDAKKYESFIRSCGIIPTVNQVESHVYYPQFKLKNQLNAHGTQMQSWASFTEGRRNIFAEPILLQIGAKYGKTSAQVALRYLIQNGIAVIPKSVHRERMKQNLDIFDFELTTADRKQIDRLNGNRSLFGWY